ncbi:PREDICTED: low affinity immunoglobulin gamma Fc region receptor II-b-like [Miniopterus natalensis]|uniref:low affinity immunoglobulin gamma Fc region receptor II-b-like n=1 Tax=Miniopterus natalensis TaxID=291302 RepID=UPI0007A6B164|nr:PREDICTED: low affinity immunoglobulin gamma Fc region receptor II-b-like [Miniopterus natalensis]
MGVPSVLPPPAASDQAGCPSHRPWGHMLLWTALLFLVPAAGTPGLPKAVVSLQPPWVNVLEEDNVTLSCQGAHSPGDHSTLWFRDGTPLLTQVQPSYSFKASSKDSGDYTCQTGQASLSDPVHLDVTSAWLLLQTPHLVFQEGDTIVLRCHSWKNWRLYKITFFQDEKPKWFSHANSSFFIPQANVSHSGEYHCSGFIGQMSHSSRPVSITVQVPSSSKAFLIVTTVVAVVAGVVAVAGVAAVVAWVCFRRHQSPGTPKNREMGDTLPEEPANITNAEEAAKVEAENTITYSLLLHPEAPEEDTGPSDYQNL